MKHLKLFTLLLAFAVVLALPLAVHAQGAAPSDQPSTMKADSGAAAQTPPEAPKAEHHKGKAKAKKSEEMKAPKIDINSATKEELMTLTGIGDVTADKIIAGRPYKSKAELVSKKAVTKKEYAKIKAKIIAKQEKTEAK